MLAHRLRRWANIEPALGGCLVFVGPVSLSTAILIDCLLFQYMLTHGTKRAEIDFMVF